MSEYYYILVDGNYVGKLILESFTKSEEEITNKSKTISKCIESVEQCIRKVFSNVDRLLLSGDSLLVKVNDNITCNEIEYFINKVFQLYSENKICEKLIRISIGISNKLELVPVALAIAKNKEYLGYNKYFHIICNDERVDDLLRELINKISDDILSCISSRIDVASELMRLGKIIQVLSYLSKIKYSQSISNNSMGTILSRQFNENIKKLIRILTTKYINDYDLRRILYNIILRKESASLINILWEASLKIYKEYTIVIIDHNQERTTMSDITDVSHIYYLLTPNNITQLIALLVKIYNFKQKDKSIILFSTHPKGVALVSKITEKLNELKLDKYNFISLHDVISNSNIKLIIDTLRKNIEKVSIYNGQSKQLIVTTSIPPTISYGLINLVRSIGKHNVSLYYIEINNVTKEIELYKVT